MSTALEAASLIMVPSGYSDGILGSVKPTDGSGNFTFTRGTDIGATRVAEDGYIEKGYENLLTYSNDFSQWTKAAITATSGQSGYDGTSDAWLVEKSNSNGVIYRTLSSISVGTISVYAKASASNWVAIYTGTSLMFFDLANGVLGGGSGEIDYKIEAVSGATGWYRCSVVDTSITSFSIYPAEGDGDRSGTSGSILLQDAQAEIGLTSTEYIESGATTGTAGILENTPRFNYSNGASCPSLLLEPSRTNLIQSSEYFESSYWAKTGVYEVDTNTTETLSPVGNYSATKIVADTTSSNSHVVYGNVSQSSGTQYAVSIFAKAAEYDYLFVRGLGLGASGGARFNISTGEVVAVNGYDSATIEDYGNGWYRCTAIGTSTSTGAPYYHMSPTSDFGPFAGNNSDGIYIFGAQCEPNAPYATSYIPNYSGGTITRAGDVCDDAGDANTFNDSEGVLFAECKSLSNTTGQYIMINDGTASNEVLMYFSTNSDRITVVYQHDGLANSYAQNISGINKTDMNKYALRWGVNNFAFFVNGVKVNEQLSGTVGTGNNFNQITFSDVSGSVNFLGDVKQVFTFNTALSDADLAALTTI